MDFAVVLAVGLFLVAGFFVFAAGFFAEPFLDAALFFAAGVFLVGFLGGVFACALGEAFAGVCFVSVAFLAEGFFGSLFLEEVVSASVFDSSAGVVFLRTRLGRRSLA